VKRLGRGLGIFFGATLLVAIGLDLHLSMPEEEPVPPAVRRWVVSALRASLDGAPAPRRPSAGSIDRELPAPLVVTLFAGGRERARVTASGRLGKATEAAGRALAKKAAAYAHDAAARIRVEIPVARGPIFAMPMLLPLELVPGRDGLGVEVNGKTAVRTSLELTGLRLWDRAFTTDPGGSGVGLQIDPVIDAFAADLGTSRDELVQGRRSYFRFRVATLVEAEPGLLLEVRDPPRRPARAALVEVALGAARWCQAVMGASGQYTYMYDPLEDREDAGARYNLPRHAGTTYFLSQAYRYTREGGLDASARRALDWMVGKHLRRCGPGKRRCMRDGDLATLGSTALAIVALAEWRHATGDHRYDVNLERLGEFLRDMQKPNGDFHHRYARSAEKVLPGQLLYYTGEAALALVKLHEELGDPRDLAAAGKALDFLSGPGWDFFYSPYYFSEEHWTCIAANEVYPRLKKRRYLDHCERFARYRRRAQYRPAEIAFPDAAGGYGFGAFATPRTTPTASTTEAMISTALLHRKWGRRSAVVEDQVWNGVRFLLRHQIGPEEEHMLPDPRRARGGFPASRVEWTIRIDYTQHAGSAILRSTDLL
jgi:hypothetical protein